ncbi:GntR family transcriptional regulator [Aminiphilus sp.]|uniref:GntR family transcriptional regulator n=1 Tax=Aminiphilus sp. TaxID=1872488 RepID=UPI00260B7ACE|nr:GntR family transcriptional regulator [Aminiphilus sp.]
MAETAERGRGTHEERQNLANRVYDEIKSRIVELRLPPESTLQERALALSLGTSRTPVREAIKRLAQDGWVLLREQRKAVVRPIGMEDVREVFMLREMVELFAIRTIFASGEPRLLAGLLVPLINNMRELSGDPIAFIKEDMKFHTTIIAHVGNGRLTDIWNRVRDEVTRIAIYALYEQRRPEAIIREHENLVDAFWERKSEETVEEMRGHFYKIYAAYEQKFRGAGETA